MATIFIKKDEVYRTRIEDVTSKDQFFYPVYEQARDSLLELIKYSKKFWKEQSLYIHQNESNMNPMRLRGYPNNFIAFCADRGHGKTSAMLSFAKALTTEKKKAEFWNIYNGKAADDEEISSFRFFSLEPIDPTVLENTDHIIPTIISRMFTEFTAKVNELRRTTSPEYSTYITRDAALSYHDLREQQQKLLRLFQECYRLADEQKDGKKRNDNYDDLQLLADRGDSSNFKVRFWELVKEYLYFMEAGKSNPSSLNCLNSFLIIQIDDADMNPEHAYDVVEDLRKYCVLPNVAILFATNLEQLEICVEQHFVKSFEPLIKTIVNIDPEAAHSNLRHCHHTTSSYMDKLIPSMHRINLPNINNTLQNYGTPIYLHHDKFHTEDEKKAPKEYQTALVSILKDRCLLQLQTESGRLHPFLPRRMRELTHFLNRMSSMEKVGTRRELLQWTVGKPVSGYDDKAPQNLKRNMEYLMDYLVYDWCDLVLEARQRKVIREIHHATTNHKIEVAIEQLQQLSIEENTKTTTQSFNPGAYASSCPENCPNFNKNPANKKSEQNPVRQENGATTAEEIKPGYSSQPDSGWSGLMKRISNLYSQEKAQFACALELYFVIYKELLLASACISRKSEISSPAGTKYNAIKITELGECGAAKINHAIHHPSLLTGGFEINLIALCKNLQISAPISAHLKLALNNWLHISSRNDSQGEKRISDLFEEIQAGKVNEEEPIMVEFDPLRFVDPDWDALSLLFDTEEADEQICNEILCQLEIRLALFANSPLQRELTTKLQNKQNTLEKDWVHFRDRINTFWEDIGAIYYGSPFSFNSPSGDILDWIFLTNMNNRSAYLKQIKETLDPDQMLKCRLKYICKLLGKVCDAIQLMPSGENYSGHLDFLSAVSQIHDFWVVSFRDIHKFQDLLDTPLTRDFYDKLKDTNSDMLKSEGSDNFTAIAKGEIPVQNAQKLLNKLCEDIESIIATWDHWMDRNGESRTDTIPEVERMLNSLDNWILSMK